MNYQLNLTKEEYLDDYISGKSANENTSNNSEFWQDNARSALVSNLYTILNDAKKYSQFRQSITGNKTWLSHNAILITGARGSGKTVFLRNTENMWKQEAHSKHNYQVSELYFLDVIDPTMLMNNDSFASVIIAQIYQAVCHKLNQQTCTDNNHRNKREQFHQSLKNLADSLGKTDEFNGCTGIDKILKYSSGIQIENRFHHFVETAIQILSCHALVVPIDDVDMALERAFEVVDEVRRFLGCPYIIPIVSGDLKLYEHMTHMHFDDKSYSQQCKNEQLIHDGKQLSKTLTTAYLTKVFPSPMRIGLFGIDKIIPTLSLILNEHKTNSSSLSYKDYIEKLLNTFYFLCKNNEARKNWPKPETARELTQLVRSLKPEDLPDRTSAHKPDITENKAQITLWSHFKNWAEQKQNGEAFTNAESALTLLHRDKGEPFDIQTLLAFNIKLQADANLYPWASYPVLKSQIERLEYLIFYSQPNKIHESNKKQESNLSILKSVLDNETRNLRPMPPVEFITTKLFIVEDTVSNHLRNKNPIPLDSTDILGRLSQTQQKAIEKTPASMEQVLLDIYTHDELYSSLNNKHKFVFFSRAFEILFYSLTGFNEKNAFNDLHQMLVRKPFYSIMALNQTKIAVIDDETDDEESEGSTTNEETQLSSAYALSVQIKKWYNEHKESITRLNQVDLIAILANCFNSSFTALNVIRENYIRNSKKHFSDEHLTDMVSRFKYNILNAVIRASIKDEAIHANVAIGAMSESMRDHHKFMQSDRTYSRNKSKLDEQEALEMAKIHQKSNAALILKTIKLEYQLHNAIEAHPIFNLVNNFNKENSQKIILKLFKLGKNNNEQRFWKELYKKDTLERNRIIEKMMSSDIKIKGAKQNKIPFYLNILLKGVLKGRIAKVDSIKTRLKSKIEISDVRNCLHYIQKQIKSNNIDLNYLNNLDKKSQNIIQAIKELNEEGFFDAQS
ncbi:antiviral RADAR system adenosine triphosphatase RdrA [uncultured Shewanella sp.]|uniref:antiviral RADAR system adenosine triphosphatase RdrA n=1 Tax=uncultured Shewanella sp. TaxID=173975 RepID=UPI00262D0C6E|nr:antiviral RADAR system adenosine triphosphatase RdrA [uncultured Shewanella sp.]